MGKEKRFLMRRLLSLGLTAAMTVTNVAPYAATEISTEAATEAASEKVTEAASEKTTDVAQTEATQEQTVAGSSETNQNETEQTEATSETDEETDEAKETKAEEQTEAAQTETQTEPAPEEYILALPHDEAVEYSNVDSAKLDESLSDDDFSILLYQEGETVSFGVEYAGDFSVVDATTMEEAFAAGSFADGKVEFAMPAKDLTLKFEEIPETEAQTEKQTDAMAEEATEADVTEAPETESAIEAESAKETETSAGEETESGFALQFVDSDDENAIIPIYVEENGVDIDVKGSAKRGAELVVTVTPDDEFAAVAAGAYALPDEDGVDAYDLSNWDEIEISELETMGNGVVRFTMTVPNTSAVTIAAVASVEGEENAASTLELYVGNAKYTGKHGKFNNVTSNYMEPLPRNSDYSAGNDAGTSKKSLDWIEVKVDGQNVRIDGVWAFCLQPKAGAPEIGTDKRGDDLEDNRAKWERLEKALYLFAGQDQGAKNTFTELWDKDVLLSDGTVLNMAKEAEAIGCKSRSQRYSLSHFILSCIYYEDVSKSAGNWNESVGSANDPSDATVFNSDGKKWVEKIAKRIGMIQGEFDMKLSRTSAPASECSESGDATYKIKSGEFTYTSIASNTLDLTLPDGVAVNYGTGLMTGAVSIPGGSTFAFYATPAHVQALKASGTDTDALEAAPKYFAGGTAIAFKTSSKMQNVGVAGLTSPTKMNLSVAWKEMTVPFSVKKITASGYESIVEGNPNYSLAGAEFTVEGGGNRYVFTTDANGNTVAQQVNPGSYTVTETKTPAGYDTAAPVTVTVDANNSSVTIQDVPKFASFDVAVKKTTGTASSVSLAGAKFNFQFTAGTASRSWNMQTIADGNVHFKDVDLRGSFIDGDPYVVNGGIVIPLGTVTFQETQAPDKLKVDSTVKTVTCSLDASGNAVASVGGTIMNDGTDSGYNHTNLPLYGDVILNKRSVDQDKTVDGDATFEGAEFTIYSNDDESVTLRTNPGKTYSKGEKVCSITTDKNGEATTKGKAAASLLQAGKYYAVETKAPVGYLLNDQKIEFEICPADPAASADDPMHGRKDGAVTDLRETAPVKETPIRGGFAIQKQDYELTYGKSTMGGNGTFQADHKFGDNGAQGDAKLSGAEFTLYNDSKSSVVVDVNGDGKRDAATETFAVGAVIPASSSSTAFVTDANGKIETASDYLPYGSYRIEETKAPEGYTDRGANLEVKFSIREDGKIVDVKNDSTSSIKDGEYASNEVIRFDSQITKINLMSSEDYNESDSWDDLEAAEGIQFEFYLESAGTDAKPYCTITVGKDATATTKSADYPHGRLPYGSYRVHEVIPDSVKAKGYPYKAVDDFYVNATQNNPTKPVKDGMMYNEFIKGDAYIEAFVKLIKLDLTSGKKVPLAGATFKVVDEDGNTVTQINHYPETKEYTTFTTVGSDKGDNAGTVALPQRLKAGTYTIVELHAPKGYVLRSAAGLEEKSFTVDYRNKAETVLEWEIEDPDEMMRLNLTKKDSVTKENIAGAVFDVYAVEDVVTPEGTVRAKAGEKVDTFTIGSDGVGHSKELYLGKYKAVETQAPEGYALNPSPVEFSSEYVDENTPVVEIYETFENVPTEFKLYKTEEVRDDRTWTGEEGPALDGITFEIKRIGGDDMVRYDNGNAITEKTVTTADGGKIDVQYLATGIYEISETKTLDGYVLDKEPRYFTVDKDGYIAQSDAEGNKAEGEKDGQSETEMRWTNKYYVRYFSKLDMGGKEIPGAQMSVTDENGKELYAWTSTEEQHVIERIPLGKYFLHEKVAAKGYVIATDVPFEITEDSLIIDDVEMTDKKLIVSKVDVAGEEIPGAKLNVTDKDGNVMDEWVSTETPHDVENLKVGESYVLHEVVAAKGYAVATNVPFTVTDDGVDQKVTMTDKKVLVSKVDVMGNEVPGAELAVYELTEDADGNVTASEEPVDSWTSTETPHDVDNLVVGKKYRLVENYAPDGYVISSEIDFTVTDDGVDQTVVMTDKRQFVLKTDAGINALAGAKLKVTDKATGETVDEWTSTGEAHAVSGLRMNGTYVLEETEAPEGYVIALPVEFTVSEDVTKDDEQIGLVNKKMLIHKVDAVAGEEIEGAHLKVTDKDGNVMDEWVSGKEPHAVENLKVGETYVLTETLPADGYVTAESIEFTVDNDFTDQHLKMEDERTKLEITKSDITTSEPVIGATLTIKDEKGNVVDEWITEEKPHYVEKLPIGKYTLTETQLPGINGMGYVTAETIEFEILDTPEIQKHEMKDDFTKLEISKTDIADSKPVIGATLQIKDAEGNVVEQWVTEEKPHYVERLPIGKYTLTEIQLPGVNGLGYVTAETIEFEITDTPEIQKHVMQDDFTKVEITKSDITDGKPVIGAELEIKDAEGNSVEKWITEEKPHYIERLPIGKYTLTETKPGDGYLTAETVEFGVLDTGEIQKVEMKDERTKLYVSKQDITNGKELPGAKLEIRDEDGKTVEKWTSGDKPHYVEMLKIGKYTLTEVTAPDGYEVAETIHFEIKDELTDDIQTVVMKDAPIPQTSTAPKTGDDFDGRPLGAAAAAAVLLGLFGAAFVMGGKRRKKED